MPKGTGAGEDRAKVKLRVIEFELEGGNSSVENSIRQLTHALIARANGMPAKAVPVKSSVVLPVGEDDPVEVESPDAEAVEDAETSAAPAKTRFRRPTVPEPIEVDVSSGDMPFKQFCDDRSVTASSPDSKKYLVAAMWMKDYRQVSAIETGHIYSIFKMMKWNLPGDIGGPLRSMKQQKWFTTPERGKFAINHLGENEVNGLSN